MIGYEFSCKIDPKFLGMPGTVKEIDCSPKVEGGSFTAMIQARVRMAVFLQGEVSDPPAGEWVTWTRTRRIRNGQGAWDGAGEDPQSIPLAVSWPVIDCEVLNNHRVTVEVIVRIYFAQRCHALNSIPGGEAKAADPIFQCLAGF